MAEALVRILDASGTPYRSALDNPSVPLDDPDDLTWEALGAVPSSSGTRVNRRTMLTYAVVWRAVNLISSDVGKLPCFVMKNEGRGQNRATEHPAYKLLRYEPNEYMTAFTFFQTVEAHRLQKGNGYIWIERNGRGDPTSLLILNPDDTFPVRVNGVLWYVTKVAGDTRKLRSENVCHIKGLGYDGLIGYDVVSFARNSLGLGLAINEYGSRYFKNSARPSLVITHPGKISKEAEAKLRESWTRMYEGLENAHKTAVLQEGMKVEPTTINARDSQLDETRQYMVRCEVANWFGIPPHKLGDNSRTSYNSLEQENQAYLDDALQPRLIQWQQELRSKLLNDDEKTRDQYSIEFDIKELIRANLEARAKYMQTAVGGPWLSRNEARLDAGVNPSDEPGMDEVLQPMNMASTQNIEDIQSPDDNGKPQPKPGDDAPDDNKDRALDEAIENMARETIGRMVRRLNTQAKRKAGDGAAVREWLAGLGESDGETIAESVEPVLRLYFPTSENVASRQLADSIIELYRSGMESVTIEGSAAKQAVGEWCKKAERDIAEAIVAGIER